MCQWKSLSTAIQELFWDTVSGRAVYLPRFAHVMPNTHLCTIGNNTSFLTPNAIPPIFLSSHPIIRDTQQRARLSSWETEYRKEYGDVFFISCPLTGALSVPRKSGHMCNADLTIMPHGARYTDNSVLGSALLIGNEIKKTSPCSAESFFSRNILAFWKLLLAIA